MVVDMVIVVIGKGVVGSGSADCHSGNVDGVNRW